MECTEMRERLKNIAEKTSVLLDIFKAEEQVCPMIDISTAEIMKIVDALIYKVEKLENEAKRKSEQQKVVETL